MSQEWTGLQAVIEAINDADSPAGQLQSFMTILLAKINLTTEEMSDSIQDAFLLYESLSAREIRTLVDGVDSHLASFRN